MLLKQGRDSREAIKPTWEFKNGCLDIFYTHILGLAFGLAQPDRVRAKQMWSSSLPVPGKAAGSKAESCWGRASAWHNDGDLGHSSEQADLLLTLVQAPRWQFWQGQPSQRAPVRPLTLVA